MLTHLGFLDEVKSRQFIALETLSQSDPLRALKYLKAGECLAAGIQAATPGSIYLYGCKDEYDVQEALSNYQDIIWYVKR